MPPMARRSFREKKRALVAKWKFMVACTVFHRCPRLRVAFRCVELDVGSVSSAAARSGLEKRKKSENTEVRC